MPLRQDAYSAVTIPPMMTAGVSVPADLRSLPPRLLPWRPGQYVVFGLWSVGVPALAAGLAMDVVSVVRLAGGASSRRRPSTLPRR
jgi:hypothetical protein